MRSRYAQGALVFTPLMEDTDMLKLLTLLTAVMTSMIQYG